MPKNQAISTRLWFWKIFFHIILGGIGILIVNVFILLSLGGGITTNYGQYVSILHAIDLVM